MNPDQLVHFSRPGTPADLRRHAAALLGALMAAAAQSALAQTDPLPGFAAVDDNTNSERHSQAVSTDEYRLQVSAYYFGWSG